MEIIGFHSQQPCRAGDEVAFSSIWQWKWCREGNYDQRKRRPEKKKQKKKNTKRNTSKQLGTEKKIIIKHRRHIKPTLFPATFPIIGFPLIAKRLSCMQNLSRNFLSPRKKIPIFPIQHMSNIHPTRCWMKSWNRFLSHMLDCARNLNQFNIYVNSVALKLCHPHLRHLRLTH